VSGADAATQTLNVSGNHVAALLDRQLADLGLTNLQRLAVARADMNTVEPRALQGLTNLVELDLSFNSLKQVSGNNVHISY
jgi:Leucine-rich repeat (LRR) protein